MHKFPFCTQFLISYIGAKVLFWPFFWQIVRAQISGKNREKNKFFKNDPLKFNNLIFHTNFVCSLISDPRFLKKWKKWKIVFFVIFTFSRTLHAMFIDVNFVSPLEIASNFLHVFRGFTTLLVLGGIGNTVYTPCGFFWLFAPSSFEISGKSAKFLLSKMTTLEA